MPRNGDGTEGNGERFDKADNSGASLDFKSINDGVVVKQVGESVEFYLEVGAWHVCRGQQLLKVVMAVNPLLSLLS